MEISPAPPRGPTRYGVGSEKRWSRKSRSEPRRSEAKHSTMVQTLVTWPPRLRSRPSFFDTRTERLASEKRNDFGNGKSNRNGPESEFCDRHFFSLANFDQNVWLDRIYRAGYKIQTPLSLLTFFEKCKLLPYDNKLHATTCFVDSFFWPKHWENKSTLVLLTNHSIFARL